MAYRICTGSTVNESVRSVAREQIDRMIDEIEDSTLDRNEAVHQVRKRCKKVRGLIRLVRPVFSGYREENAFFRDAAQPLSCVRDAQAIVESYDKLLERFGEQVDCDRLAPIRERLIDRRREIVRNQVVLEDRLGEVLEQMREARARVDSWDLEEEGFPAVAGGLKKTYKRAREGLRVACREPGEANFHEWRKRVKYHWCHSRLLRGIWPRMMEPRAHATKRLSGLLGNEHDLSVFRRRAVDHPDSLAGDGDVQVVIGLIDRRRVELRGEARPLGEKLFAERPKPLVERYSSYWTIACESTAQEE